MGKIIYQGIIRLAILLPILWLAVDYFEYKYWWAVVSLTVYGFIFHPAYIQYQIWFNANKKIITNSLCSSCRHFDETAIICLKLDEHPTEKEIPCEGSAWEPI
ncbi:MAG: hypothetical protein CR986_07865 [Ignavibacteriae bacterium]|nr:MAG: hypothetical protein CR986_07865 [Ignavibacteriota bacterium]